MPRIYLVPSFMLAAAVLAGCSSGSSTATPGGDTVVQLNFGTTSETESSNGQPFADEIAVDDNGAPLAGEGFDNAGQVLLVSRSTDGTSDEVVINLANANYSIDRGDPGVGGDGAFILEINGEDIPFAFGADSGGMVLVGESEDGTEYEIRTASNGVFSSTNLISIVNGDDAGPFGLYTFGFETNPSQLPTGTAIYSGLLAGAVYSDGDSSELSGTIRFNADFDTSRISGSANATAFEQNIDFTIDETDIVGNGFTTTATAVCPIPDACESNSQIGGAFFGPDGSEISGIAVIDETITTDLGTSNVVGAAGYTATSQPN